MNKLKVLAASLAVLSMLTVSVPADARAGSPFGASRSVTMPTSSTFASPSKPAGRAGGGEPIGIQRSEAMSQARAQRSEPTSSYTRSEPAPSAPAGSSNAFSSSQPGRDANSNASVGQNPPRAAPSYAGGGNAYPQAEPVQRRGWSGTQIAGAAAVAGIAGYAIGHSGPSQAAPLPSVSPGQGSTARLDGPAESTTRQESASSSLAAKGTNATEQTASLFVPLVFILAALGGAYVLFRVLRGNAPAFKTSSVSGRAQPVPPPASDQFFRAEPSAGPGDQDLSAALLSAAPGIFRNVQDANNRGDLDQLERLIDDGELLQYFVKSIGERSDESRTRVLGLRIVGNKVLDLAHSPASHTGSIHFEAEIAEGDEQAEVIQEVWHFTRPVDGGTWKLSGIEQL